MRRSVWHAIVILVWSFETMSCVPFCSSYSQKPGFARIVDVAPARVDTDKLPAGKGFAFEYRTSRLDNGVQPIMDCVTLEFE